MEKNPLTSREKKELRGVAQRLRAAIHVGKQGLTDAVLKALDLALSREELVKVRFDVGREELRELCGKIEEQSQSECVGGVGRTASFYRPKPEAPRGDS